MQRSRIEISNNRKNFNHILRAMDSWKDQPQTINPLVISTDLPCSALSSLPRALDVMSTAFTQVRISKELLGTDRNAITPCNFRQQDICVVLYYFDVNKHRVLVKLANFDLKIAGFLWRQEIVTKNFFKNSIHLNIMCRYQRS